MPTSFYHNRARPYSFYCYKITVGSLLVSRHRNDCLPLAVVIQCPIAAGVVVVVKVVSVVFQKVGLVDVKVEVILEVWRNEGDRP